MADTNSLKKKMLVPLTYEQLKLLGIIRKMLQITTKSLKTSKN